MENKMGRKITTKVLAEINRQKIKLIKKAKEKGMYENFGENEARFLEGKFNYLQLKYGTTEERQAAMYIDNFDNWCSNFDLSSIK